MDDNLHTLKQIRSNTTLIGLMVMIIMLIQIGSCVRSL